MLNVHEKGFWCELERYFSTFLFAWIIQIFIQDFQSIYKIFKTEFSIFLCWNFFMWNDWIFDSTFLRVPIQSLILGWNFSQNLFLHCLSGEQWTLLFKSISFIFGWRDISMNTCSENSYPYLIHQTIEIQWNPWKNGKSTYRKLNNNWFDNDYRYLI